MTNGGSGKESASDMKGVRRRQGQGWMSDGEEAEGFSPIGHEVYVWSSIQATYLSASVQVS